MKDREFKKKMKDEAEKFSKKVHDEISPVVEREVEAKIKNRTTEYIWAIIANIFTLWIFNNLLDWNFPYLTTAFIPALAIFNIAFVATIISNFLLLFFDKNWFRALNHLILNILGILALYTLFITFPFNSSGMPDLTIRIIIIAALIATAIAMVVEIFKLIFRKL